MRVSTTWLDAPVVAANTTAHSSAAATTFCPYLVFIVLFSPSLIGLFAPRSRRWAVPSGAHHECALSGSCRHPPNDFQHCRAGIGLSEISRATHSLGAGAYFSAVVSSDENDGS